MSFHATKHSSHIHDGITFWIQVHERIVQDQIAYVSHLNNTSMKVQIQAEVKGLGAGIQCRT